MRAAYLMAALGFVWALSLGYIADRVGGFSGEPAIFWAGLGTALLGVSGVVLALSGLLGRREARGGLWGALILNTSLLFVAAWWTVQCIR